MCWSMSTRTFAHRSCRTTVDSPRLVTEVAMLSSQDLAAIARMGMLWCEWVRLCLGGGRLADVHECQMRSDSLVVNAASSARHA